MSQIAIEITAIVDAARQSLQNFGGSIDDLGRRTDLLSSSFKSQRAALLDSNRELRNFAQSTAATTGSMVSMDQVIQATNAAFGKLVQQIQVATGQITQLGNQTQNTTTKMKGLFSLTQSNPLGTLGRQLQYTAGTMQLLGNVIGNALFALGPWGVAIAGAATATFLLGGFLAKAGIDAANYAEKVRLLSDQTGFSTQTAQEYSAAIELLGARGQSLVTMMRSLYRGLSDTSEEGAKTKEALYDLGITIRDPTTGALKTMDQIFPEILDKLRGVDVHTQRGAEALKIFSRAGVDFIGVLPQLDEALKKVRESGIVMEDGTITKLSNVNTEMNAFKLHWKANWHIIGEAVDYAGESLARWYNRTVGIVSASPSKSLAADTKRDLAGSTAAGPDEAALARIKANDAKIAAEHDFFLTQEDKYVDRLITINSRLAEFKGVDPADSTHSKDIAEMRSLEAEADTLNRKLAALRADSTKPDRSSVIDTNAERDAINYKYTLLVDEVKREQALQQGSAEELEKRLETLEQQKNTELLVAHQEMLAKFKKSDKDYEGEVAQENRVYQRELQQNTEQTYTRITSVKVEAQHQALEVIKKENEAYIDGLLKEVAANNKAQEAIRTAREHQVNTDIEIAERDVAERLKYLEALHEAHILSDKQYEQQTESLYTVLRNMEVRELKDELALIKGNTDQEIALRQHVADQIALIENKQNQRIADADRKLMSERLQIWSRVSNQIEEQMNGLVGSILRGNLTIANAFRKMGQDIIIDTIQWLAKTLIAHEKNVILNGILQRQQAAQSASARAIEQAASAAAVKSMAATQVQTDAGVAAAGAYSATAAIPFIGPELAPEAAAQALSQTLSFGTVSAEGGAVLPNMNTIGFLHPKEMVLPADISTGLQGAIKGNGIGGGTTVNQHFNMSSHSFDPSTFGDFLNGPGGRTMLGWMRENAKNYLS